MKTISAIPLVLKGVFLPLELGWTHLDSALCGADVNSERRLLADCMCSHELFFRTQLIHTRQASVVASIRIWRESGLECRCSDKMSWKEARKSPEGRQIQSQDWYQADSPGRMGWVSSPLSTGLRSQMAVPSLECFRSSLHSGFSLPLPTSSSLRFSHCHYNNNDDDDDNDNNNNNNKSCPSLKAFFCAAHRDNPSHATSCWVLPRSPIRCIMLFIGKKGGFQRGNVCPKIK